MRLARKLTLLALVAMASLAMTASSASAIEVGNEVADPSTAVTHCSAVAAATHGAGSGGCVIHANGTAVNLTGPFTNITCNNEFFGRTNEAGVGYIYQRTFTNCTGGTVTPCSEAAGQDTWDMNLTTTTNMEADFCVVVSGITITCHININVSVAANHNTGTFSTGGGARACENPFFGLNGTWNIEFGGAGDGTEIEVR